MSNALHVVLAVLALVGAAHAQTEDSLALTLTSAAFSDDDRKVIGAADCASQVTQALNLTGTLTGSYTGYSLRLTWTTGTTRCDRDVFSNCNNATEVSGEETCGCLAEVDEVSTITSTQYDFSDLLDAPCAQDTGESSVRFFLEYYNSTDGTEVNSPAVEVTFDFEAPATPAVEPTVVAADGALQVSFVEADDGDVDYYEVCSKLAAAENCVNSSDNSQRLEGLSNGESYAVYYRVVDYAGNKSLPSPEASGSPEASQDFAEFYFNRGGKATGCAARPGHGAPGWLWLCLPLLGLARRRRGAALVLGLTVIAFAQPAFALNVRETPRDSVFEIRMGSYLPNIDDEFGDQCNTGNCPYASSFQSADPLMITFSYHRHLFTGFGSLTAGGGFGYWNNDEGQAITSSPEDPVVYAQDATEISVYPFFLELGYRLDVIQDIIPLVPAFKVGVDAYGWRVFDGSGEVARFNGTSGEAAGFSYGWHASLGVHILLDFFAPDMAADFDRDAGVNNSYLTIDYQTAQISNFGAGETLWLGSDVLFIGLALDM